MRVNIIAMDSSLSFNANGELFPANTDIWLALVFHTISAASELHEAMFFLVGKNDN